MHFRGPYGIRLYIFFKNEKGDVLNLGWIDSIGAKMFRVAFLRSMGSSRKEAP